MSAPLPRGIILAGDAHRQLRDLQSGSVDCVVTSPPYFRLRDYDVPGQLGREPAIADWVARLRLVVRELARVLVPTGSLWLNLGDSYATHLREGAARKSLLLGPERLALALLSDGWLVRNKIIWSKPTVMPTSAPDRLRCSWEVVYLLVRQPKYFFDLDAIREPHTSHAAPQRRPHAAERHRGPNAAGISGLLALKRAGLPGHPLGKNPGDVWRLTPSALREPHPAMFPVDLARRAILTGCPERRCASCWRPYRRAVLRALGGTATRGRLTPSCDCPPSSEPGTVLDPFMGSGTTAVAAEEVRREWLGIEINPGYRALAQRRLAAARAHLASQKEVTRAPDAPTTARPQ